MSVRYLLIERKVAWDPRQLSNEIEKISPVENLEKEPSGKTKV